MKEVTFIRRNIEKWKETEKVVEKADKFNPDRLADAYTELTADLAFAQTHYPSSRITIYLNNLAFALHNVIYRNKREKWTRILLSGRRKCRKRCMMPVRNCWYLFSFSLPVL